MASNKLKQIIIDAKEIRKEVERRAQRTILAENSGKLDSLIRKLLSEGEEEQSLKPGDDDSFAPDEPAVPTDNVPTNARNIENGTEPVNPNGEADESGQISDIADLLNGLDAEELAALVNNMDTTEEPSDTDLPAANPEDTTASPEETKTDITSTTIDEPTADQAPTEKTPSTEPEFMETKQPAMNDEEITRIMKEAEDYFKEDKDVVIAHRETQDQVTKDSTKMDGEEKPLNEEKDIYKQDKPAGKPTEKGIRPDEQAKKTQMVYEGSGVDKAAADYGKGYPSYETQTKGGDGVKSPKKDVEVGEGSVNEKINVDGKGSIIAKRTDQSQITKDSDKSNGEEKPLTEEKDIYAREKPTGKPTEKGIRPDEQAKKTQMVYESEVVIANRENQKQVTKDSDKPAGFEKPVNEESDSEVAMFENLSESDIDALLEGLDEEVDPMSEEVVIANRETQDQVTKNSDKFDGEEKPAASKENNDIYEGLSMTGQTQKNVGSFSDSHIDGRPERRSNLDQKSSITEGEIRKLVSSTEKLLKENKALKASEELAMKKLYEAALLLEKLTSVNKLMLEHTLNREQKVTILTSISKLNDRKEVQNEFQRLSEGLISEKGILSEGTIRTNGVSASSTETPAFRKPIAAKMADLINLTGRR